MPGSAECGIIKEKAISGVQCVDKNTRVLVTPASDGDIPFLRNIEVRLAGYFNRAEGQYMEQEDGSCCLLLFCTEGQGFAEIDGRVTLVNSGEAVLLLPGDTHVYGAGAEHPWSILWVSFTGQMVDFLREKLEISGSGTILRRNTRESLPLLEQVLSILAEGQDLMRLLEASACLQLALCRMTAQNLCYGAQRRHVERAREYLLAHIEKETSLEELSAATGVSKFYLIRIFKAHFGTSPMEYLRGVRMQRACDLLLETDLPVKEIGRQLSYSSAYHFAQCFRQYAGCSPSVFRKSMGKGRGR